MGGRQNRHAALLIEPQEQLQEIFSGGRIEIGARFIGEQQRRGRRDRARNRHALLLAAGELAGSPIGKLGEPYAVQQFFGNLAPSGRGNALQLQDKLDILAGIQYRHEVVGLKNEPEPMQTQIGELSFVEDIQLLTRDFDVPAGGPVQPANQIEQSSTCPTQTDLQGSRIPRPAW